MHTYKIKIRHYFKDYEYFNVDAENKAEALLVAKKFVDMNPYFWGGNFDKNSIEVVKKMKK